MRLLVCLAASIALPAAAHAMSQADPKTEAMAVLAAIAPPGASPSDLSKTQADQLIDAVGFVPAFDEERVRIYRLADAVYRRELPADAFERETALSPLAQLLMEIGRPEEAEALLRERFEHYVACCTIDSGGAFDYAVRLGRALAAQQRFAEARLLADRLWQVVEPWNQWDNEAVVEVAESRVRLMLADGAHGAATAFASDLVDRARGASVSGDLLLRYLNLHAAALLSSGDLVGAEGAAVEARGLVPTDWAVGAAFDTPAATTHMLLATVWERSGQAAEAEPLRREVLAKTEANEFIPLQAELHREATLALALNLAQQGKPEADALLRSYGEARARVYGAQSPQVIELAGPHARFLLRIGRAGAALSPARAALAGTLAQSRRVVSASGQASGITGARDRQDAAVTLVEAAWGASRQ